MFASNRISNGSALHRGLAILAFVAAGLLSAYAFVSVTRLPVVDGAGDDTLKIAVSLAWISIFPLWIGLYFCLMLLLAIVEETLRKLR